MNRSSPVPPTAANGGKVLDNAEIQKRLAKCASDAAAEMSRKESAEPFKRDTAVTQFRETSLSKLVVTR